MILLAVVVSILSDVSAELYNLGPFSGEVQAGSLSKHYPLTPEDRRVSKNYGNFIEKVKQDLDPLRFSRLEPIDIDLSLLIGTLYSSNVVVKGLSSAQLDDIELRLNTESVRNAYSIHADCNVTLPLLEIKLNYIATLFPSITQNGILQIKLQGLKINLASQADNVRRGSSSKKFQIKGYMGSGRVDNFQVKIITTRGNFIELSKATVMKFVHTQKNKMLRYIADKFLRAANRKLAEYTDEEFLKILDLTVD